MKIALCVIQILLCAAGVGIYFDLSKYCKKHAQEKLDTHKKYIISRMIAILILIIVIGVVGIVLMILK